MEHLCTGPLRIYPLTICHCDEFCAWTLLIYYWTSKQGLDAKQEDCFETTRIISGENNLFDYDQLLNGVVWLDSESKRATSLKFLKKNKIKKTTK